MADPITTTVLVTLAATKFIEGGAGELGKKFTAGALNTMDSLWQLIKERFTGKKPNAESAIAAIEQGSKSELDMLSKYLDAEMLDDPEFASQLQVMAQEIRAGKIQDNSSMRQEVVGDNNTNVQAKAEDGGTQYIAQTMNFGTPPQN